MATAQQLRPGVVAEWVDPQEEQALTTDVSAQLAGLPSVIDSPETYRLAKESLPVLKRAEDRVISFFRDIKDAAFKAHKAVTTKETAQLKPIKDARNMLATLIYNYEREQDRLRREREQVAAEEERKRLEGVAIAEAAALSSDAPEMAEQIVAQALAAPAPIVVLPSTTLDVSGVSSTENWQFVYMGGSPGQKWKDLTDAQRRAVLQLMPREYLQPDESAIGKVVKAMKGGTRIPGIQSYDAGSVRVRG